MSKPSGLIQRKYVYAFRQRIPADVVSAFGGKREIKVSLRTRDGRTARRLCLIEAAKWETEFARIREQRGFSLVDRRTASLTVSELEARIHRYVEVESAQQLDDFVSCQWTKGQRDDRTVETGELRCAYRDPAEIQTLIDIYSTERRLFGKSGIPDNFSEHHKTQIREIIRQALLEIEDRALAWLQYDRSGHTVNRRFTRPLEPSIALQQLAKEYLDEYKKTNPLVGTKRKNSLEKAIALVTEFLGPETLVSHVSAKHCREFRDLVNELPSNFRKHYPDKSLTLREIVRSGKEEGLPNMAKNTQETYVRGIKMLFDWAEREEHTKRNPARDIKPLAKKRLLRMPATLLLPTN